MSDKIQKTKAGRPTSITPATVSKLEQSLRDGFSVEMACHVSGISRSTYYAHLQADEDFSDKMALSQTWATERAKQVIIQAINAGDIKVCQWWLERRSRAEFGANPAISRTQPQTTSSPVSEQARDMFGGHDRTKMMNLTAKILSDLKVPVPPPIK